MYIVRVSARVFTHCKEQMQKTKANVAFLYGKYLYNNCVCKINFKLGNQIQFYISLVR